MQRVSTMIYCECVYKFRDANGVIRGYTLRDTKGNTQNIVPEQLKSAIKSGKISVVNLKLASDNRLVDSNANHLKYIKLLVLDAVTEVCNIMDILFSYSWSTTEGFLGELAGKKLTIYSDGKFKVVRQYLGTDKEDILAEGKIDIEGVRRITDRVKYIQQKLQSFPDRIDNDSCDGSWNHFRFGDKQIVTMNLPDDIGDYSFDYVVDNQDIIKNELIVKLAFNDIRRILDSYGIEITLYSIDVNLFNF